VVFRPQKLFLLARDKAATSKALFKAARDPSPKITHPTKNKGHYFSCLHSLTSLSISHLSHHRRCTPIAWRLSPPSLRPPGGHPYPSPPPLPLPEGHPRILPRPLPAADLIQSSPGFGACLLWPLVLFVGRSPRSSCGACWCQQVLMNAF
jgi:hypothetical protein